MIADAPPGAGQESSTGCPSCLGPFVETMKWRDVPAHAEEMTQWRSTSCRSTPLMTRLVSR
jgi:hypothetical protein